MLCLSPSWGSGSHENGERRFESCPGFNEDVFHHTSPERGCICKDPPGAVGDIRHINIFVPPYEKVLMSKQPKYPYGGTNETNQLWRDVHKEQRRHKERNRNSFLKELDMIGLDYKRLTNYQYRFSLPNNVIDIYPTNKKYHNITDQTRGRYTSLCKFLAPYMHQ